MNGIWHSLTSQILRDFAGFMQTNLSANIDRGCLLIGEKEVAPYMLETEMETMVKKYDFI